MQHIQASWLVGADGKTCVVRKQFLEPTVDIRQEVGLFSYNGTWIAANLFITPPTPQSHPELCFWDMGMTSEDVYDLFWPDKWHFCSPPGKATACGRFGPREARLWRHEFAEPNWNDSKDATKIMWEHLTPLITRKCDSLGRPFPTGLVTFPCDCVDVRRCRPFTFCQKVVNKWFHNRTILIGDAAHVFPPFGGQGIAYGIRDGDSLTWRLAILSRLSSLSGDMSDNILHTWALERRQGVDDSTRLTMMNGMLCNVAENWRVFFLRTIVAPLLSLIPGLPSLSKTSVAYEKEGYRATKDGFFLQGYGGGGKLSQIYVKSHDNLPVLSDSLLQHGQSVMTLLVLNPESQSAMKEVEKILRRCQVPEAILSRESIVFMSSDRHLFGCRHERLGSISTLLRH
jgi:2-polyprenyl-6-methoxyphenol hydroxylase-like FAD-dependent oxidoreductase